MRIVITNIERAAFTNNPTFITITAFNYIGAEKFRTRLPVSMLQGEPEEGTELVLIPKYKMPTESKELQ